MKISSSEVSLTSQRSSVEVYNKSERLVAWTGNSPPSEGSAANNGVILELSKDSLSILSEKSQIAVAAQKDKELIKELSDKERLKVMLIESFFRHFLKRNIKLRVMSYEDLKISTAPVSQPLPEQPTRLGWGLSYDMNETRYESEKVSFGAKGIVRTADGKEIKLDIDIKASREFLSQVNISIRAGDALLKDPLVINFQGRAFNLTETKYSFDIDCDGQPDQISFAGPGSGFLSLDLNSDGIINDGSELFGAASGDGFADLAKYDEDLNGWIDENDSVFHKLRIWHKDSSGNDHLIALGEKGIGAIYLSNISTEFSIKSGTALKGITRKTGIFLREDGSAGTIQHIDLSI